MPEPTENKSAASAPRSRLWPAGLVLIGMTLLCVLTVAALIGWQHYRERQIEQEIDQVLKDAGDTAEKGLVRTGLAAT